MLQSAFTYPLYIAIQAKDVEDLVSIDLRGLQAIYHKNWRVSVRTVLGRWRSISRTVALVTPTTPTHAWPHAMGRRGAIAVIVVAMITSLWSTLRWGKTPKQTSKTKKTNIIVTDFEQCPFFYMSH